MLARDGDTKTLQQARRLTRYNTPQPFGIARPLDRALICGLLEDLVIESSKRRTLELTGREYNRPNIQVIG